MLVLGWGYPEMTIFHSRALEVYRAADWNLGTMSQVLTFFVLQVCRNAPQLKDFGVSAQVPKPRTGLVASTLFGSFPKLGVPYHGVLIIRILLFSVLYHLRNILGIPNMISLYMS